MRQGSSDAPWAAHSVAITAGLSSPMATFGGQACRGVTSCRDNWFRCTWPRSLQPLPHRISNTTASVSMPSKTLLSATSTIVRVSLSSGQKTRLRARGHDMEASGQRTATYLFAHLSTAHETWKHRRMPARRPMCHCLLCNLAGNAVTCLRPQAPACLVPMDVPDTCQGQFKRGSVAPSFVVPSVGHRPEARRIALVVHTGCPGSTARPLVTWRAVACMTTCGIGKYV
ncbi:hypothetical protein L226DRAFT_273580 [Lentinus tigrinus ALCF2SS1-7]|uniref:uncharacterized protein n=1 Tax=Lentinus tigrinus ALCF2SS1-7 TaxID=1328758 RepID=UPI001165C98E|nr:hypothetical protein L226DRAFT_273580 [Lentinus tigrinus ALCF2SS1-7]